MGTLADSLFSVLMGWVRTLVDALWALMSADHTTALEFLSKNWMIIAAALIAAGLVIDWIIYLLRWQPYHLWAQRARRVLHIQLPEDEEEEDARPAKAHAAMMPQRKIELPQEQDEPYEDVPLYLGEEDAQAALDYAQHAPDEHAYPGMRYDSAPEDVSMEETARYSALTREGPGAEEAKRRRAEIDAWQQQMQDEARMRAEAEAAQRAEQARLAQEERRARQERLAQEQYARELAEYERQKAEYEAQLAEYERQKAEYEAQLEAQAAKQEQAQEIAPETAPARRRRGGRPAEEAAPIELPDAPAWPQMEEQAAKAQGAGLKASAPKPEAKKPKKENKLLSRMASMMEAEEESLAARTKLPPRIDMRDAFRPAAAPEGKKSDRSGRKG